jgi:hypothetical protein
MFAIPTSINGLALPGYVLWERAALRAFDDECVAKVTSRYAIRLPVNGSVVDGSRKAINQWMQMGAYPDSLN